MRMNLHHLRTPKKNHLRTPMKAVPRRLLAVSYTRSGSADDLRALAVDVPPKTDFMATWTIKFGHTITQLIASENTPVDEICDRAAELGLALEKWTAKVERSPGRINVICSLLEPVEVEASIHLGNQEWAGQLMYSIRTFSQSG
jgi:hypothetical protein